jgi:ribose/xylose/arabinose/galactoside ABC-type transport system permease subunit
MIFVQSLILAIMRFSLSAWVGMVTFFVLVVLDILDTALTDRLGRYNHPAEFLPYYFGFAFTLLGTASVCAVAGLWNSRINLMRRIATLLVVLGALGLASLDYAVVYRGIAMILATPNAILASKFVMLYEKSRLLKEVVLPVSVVAACLAIWPQASAQRVGTVEDIHPC